MRILLTVHQFFPKYSSGTEVLTLDTAKELLRRGHEVRVLAAEPVPLEDASSSAYEVDEYQGIKVYRINHNLGIAPHPVRYEYCDKDIASLMENIIQDFHPEIVHVLHCARLTASIIGKARDRGIPVVFTATDFWVICPLSQLRMPDNSTCTGPNINSTNCLKCYVEKTQPRETIDMLNKIPSYALTLINGLAKLSIAERWEKGKMVNALVKRKGYLAKILNRANVVIAPTDIMLQMLTRNGIKGQQLIKLPYGLNLKNLTAEAPTKTRHEIINFAFIGTLYEHKGTHILIEAFNKLSATHSNIRLKIYGDLTHFPDYVRGLKALANDNPNIEFAGTFPNSTIGEVFKGIDVLVVPSIWYENTPLVIFSAFNTKTPVIATDLGGMAEVVHHNQNGLLFHKEDSDSLAKQMERFIVEPDLLENLSAGCPEVKSIEQNVTELEELYNNLL